MGRSHHFFRTLRKVQNSSRMESFDIQPPRDSEKPEPHRQKEMIAGLPPICKPFVLESLELTLEIAPILLRGVFGDPEAVLVGIPLEIEEFVAEKAHAKAQGGEHEIE